MNIAIFFIILIIAFVFWYFSDRIKNLEKEITDLRKILEKETAPAEIKADELPEKKNRNEEHALSFSPTDEPTFPEKESKESWVAQIFDFVGQNILTIIGIFTLVLGIGYFVKYAIDKNWIGETARFAIGIFTGLIIIGAGYFIRKKYGIFASIITGGGISVLFLSITLAFQEYHLFSQTTAFILLIITTVIAIAIAYLYNSEVLIIFALIGGFGAPLMVSTGHSNYTFLFTYLGVLNLGMLAIAYLKGWQSIGWFSFIASYIYAFFWVSDQPEFRSVFFFAFFYILFYAFALRNYFKIGLIGAQNMLLLVLINISTITIITYIFKRFDFEPLILFPLLFAGINAILWLYSIKSKKPLQFPPYFIAIGISLVTIGVALQFKTSIVTSIWAIESVLLLYFWKKTGQKFLVIPSKS